MKKFLFIIVTLVSLFTPSFVFASTGITSEASVRAFIFGSEADLIENTTSSDLQGRIATILQTAFSILAVIAVILIVYAGVLWVTAAGSDEQVAKAKKIIRNTIIAMIVLGLAYGIVTFAISFASGRRLIS